MTTPRQNRAQNDGGGAETAAPQFGQNVRTSFHPAPQLRQV